MVLAISVRRSWAITLFSLGMAAQAQGYVQCSSNCASTTSGFFCKNGYEEHLIWYAQYVPGSSNNVDITDQVVCTDPSGNDVMSTTCTEPVYDSSCTGGGGGGGGDPSDQSDGYGSPILISFKGEQDDDDFALCGPDDPVTFDIAADGNPWAISWTRRGAKVGFLALDRNGNGLIDSGAELFGNHTPLADGTSPNKHSNGYLALASYDLRENGGNQDGRITAEDRIWSSLRVWIDKNHDGVSQPQELFTLDMMNIVEIGLGYGMYDKLDKYGNLFRFKSYAITSDKNGRRHAIPTWDVFFVKATR